MPYSVRKRSCKDSDGNSGSYVLIKKDTGEEVSCHNSKESAKNAIRARYASEGNISKAELENVDFNAPFTKEETNYRLEDSGYDACYNCVHFEEIDDSAGVGLCHLVQGFIKSSYTCDFYATTLMDYPYDNIKSSILEYLGNISYENANIKDIRKSHYRLIVNDEIKTSCAESQKNLSKKFAKKALKINSNIIAFGEFGFEKIRLDFLIIKHDNKTKEEIINSFKVD